MHRLQELVRLHRLGSGPREVARLLRMSPNTERRYREALSKAELLAGPADAMPALEALKAAVLEHAPPKVAPQQQSKLEPWKARIETLLDAGLGPQAIWDRLRLEDTAFPGKLGGVKRMVARIRRERGVRPEDVAIPVVTAPGEVAQVDFGYAGYRWDPVTRTERKSWVFVLVLGHSRHIYSEVVFDQRAETWLLLHERAFRWLGGVPKTIVPDNLKAAVIRAAFAIDDDASLHRSYRELARHYGFRIDPTPPRSPEKKGKVEASVKYVKHNFLAGRDGEPIDSCNRELQRWIVQIAGQRIHGTTGKRPLDVFEAEERAALLPLPQSRYEPTTWKQASVHRDSHVVFEKRQYSVPWRLIGRKVWIRATPTTVCVYADDERVATHRRRGEGARQTDEAHLPPERAALRHRSREHWEERADRMGEAVGRYIREIFDADDVLSQLRKVQAIVTHLETFPPERAQRACQRASFYGAMSYQAIKTILRQGLDMEPLPTSRLPGTWADTPRFARTWAAEGSDERH